MLLETTTQNYSRRGNLCFLSFFCRLLSCFYWRTLYLEMRNNNHINLYAVRDACYLLSPATDRIIMQFWQCPLLLMVSLIAAINTQQTPSQRLEPNQVAGLVELQQQQVQPIQGQQQQEQPSQSDNKVGFFLNIFCILHSSHPPAALVVLNIADGIVRYVFKHVSRDIV